MKERNQKLNKSVINSLRSGVLMARMHTRKRGKSGSKRIYGEKPAWIQYTNEEIVNTITELKKNGTPSSVIGIRLRDQYGIPSVKAVMGKKINKILEEKGMKDEIPEDLSNLIKKYNNASTRFDNVKNAETCSVLQENGNS